MNSAGVLHAVCQFFGGPYDPPSRTYRTPTVAGIGLVRRAFPREENFADYTLGMPPGTATGCIVVAQISDIHDGQRVALPAVQGRRKVRHSLDLHCFFWSTAAYPEDTSDAVYALRDAITALMRTDPTMGTGGIENNAFQVGEGEDGQILTHIEQGNTIDGATKAYMSISFEAHAYDVG